MVERAAGDLGGLAASVNWGGCAVTRRDAAHSWVTRALPILMYHRIASDGPSELAAYRVPRDRFERQLAYLRRHGYRTISLARWHEARDRRDGIIDDRAVALTFDDGYRDFLTETWPLLCAYGFGATLCVTTDWVGGRAEWDSFYGEPAELLGWDELRSLAAAGVEIAAHGRSHAYLTRLPQARLVAEGIESRLRLESELGRPVTAMAYPYGDENRLVRRTMAGCGYVAALTTRPGLARLADDPMSMPRQLIAGDDDLDAFVAKLGRPTRATLDRRLVYAWRCRARTNLI
jgi:peptidoglycan/xylan/chitin deacetylase (PgdA/CDA1 family)